MLIRPALAQEAAAISALCLRSKAHWGYDADFLEKCRDALTLTPAQVPACPTAVAELDGAIRGVARVAFDAQTASLELFFVDAGWIGRGIGTTLFGWVTETARGLGATRLDIESDPGAVPFYVRMGACQIGTVPSSVIANRVLPRLELRL